MKRMLRLGGFAVFLLVAAPAWAADEGQGRDLCYWCMRDGVYADTGLIDRLEANPDIDDGAKAAPIRDSRAEIHRLRAILGPAVDTRPEPCCYSRKPLVVR